MQALQDIENALAENCDSENESEIQKPSLEETLLKAAETGDIASVTDIINQGVDIECRNDIGETPLILAAVHDHHSIVQLLINAGASLIDEASEHDEGEALTLVCQRKDYPNTIEVLMTALRANPEVWSTYTRNNEWGRAISAAATLGFDESLKVLLKHLDAYSQTLEEDARKNFKNDYLEHSNESNNTSLMRIARSHTAKEGTKILLEAGAPLNTRDSDQSDALCHAARAGLPNILGYLIEALKKDPVYFKKYCEDLSMQKVFIAIARFEGNDKNSKEKITQVVSAFSTTSPSEQKMLQYLQTRSVDVEYTALHWAAHRCKFETTKYLVNLGAPLDAKTNAGKTALDLAKELPIPAENENTNITKEAIIKLLENAENLMVLCAKNSSSAEVPNITQLLQNGANVNQRDILGNTPLYNAIATSQKQIVIELLQKHAKLDLLNVQGITPLQLAISNAIAQNYKDCSIYFECLVRLHRSPKYKGTYDELKMKVQKIYAFMEKQHPKNILLKAGICLLLGDRLKYDLLPKHLQFKSIAWLSFEAFNKIPKASSYFQQAQYEISEMLVTETLSLNDMGHIQITDNTRDYRQGLLLATEEMKEMEDKYEMKKQLRIEKALFHALEAGDYPPAVRLRAQLTNNVADLGLTASHSAFGDLCQSQAIVKLVSDFGKLQKNCDTLHTELKNSREELALLRAQLASQTYQKNEDNKDKDKDKDKDKEIIPQFNSRKRERDKDSLTDNSRSEKTLKSSLSSIDNQ